jgi:hypothetical protein
MCTIKHWASHFDPILSRLSRGLSERKLLKIKIQAEPFAPEELSHGITDVQNRFKFSSHEASYLVFTGEATNTTYNLSDERIKILFKNGHVSDISKVDNALIHQHTSGPVKKYYLCHLR